ncbi:MAG: DUF2970 domain-containing protein [Candidatus Competibacteraceae bacterium]|nr:DUF2970 domain-containing protein [Candidatus Competibacteraceae bacterium]
MTKNAQSPTLWQVALSVLASFFGVQSQHNRERDFRHGRPGQFIVVGLVMTVLFVLVVWGVVQLVLRLTLAGQVGPF